MLLAYRNCIFRRLELVLWLTGFSISAPGLRQQVWGNDLGPWNKGHEIDCDSLDDFGLQLKYQLLSRTFWNRNFLAKTHSKIRKLSDEFLCQGPFWHKVLALFKGLVAGSIDFDWTFLYFRNQRSQKSETTKLCTTGVGSRSYYS